MLHRLRYDDAFSFHNEPIFDGLFGSIGPVLAKLVSYGRTLIWPSVDDVFLILSLHELKFLILVHRLAAFCKVIGRKLDKTDRYTSVQHVDMVLAWLARQRIGQQHVLPRAVHNGQGKIWRSSR